MELHERLTAARPVAPTAGRDPFAELKNRVHLTVIGELGPQLFNVAMDPEAPLERLLHDDSVTEIMVNGPYDVWIERQGRLYETNVRFNDDSHLRRIVNKIVAQVGRRIDESSPLVDARLPDGSRVNAVIPPLSLTGALVTIRKFSKRRLDLGDMVRLGTLSGPAVEFLEACVNAELNI